VRCSNIVHDPEGNYKTSALEFETLTLLGGSCAIKTFDEVAELDRLCDEVGLDTIETGGAIAILMDSGGMEWGDSAAAIGLLKEIAEGTELGRAIGNGAVAAGARDGWAYVWPRDAGAVAIALAASGYPPEARHIARFLSRLDLDAAARFEGAGDPVPGRAAQGDAAGWAIAAGRAAGLRPAVEPPRWRNRADYHEGDSGDFLGNAIATAGGASGALRRRPPRGPEATAMLSRRFGFGGGLVRRAGDPESGLDSAAAWAVRPFSLPGLRDEARRTLHRLAGGRGRFGITPGEGWRGGVDPWSAPTAWSAWGLAALAAEARERGNLAPARSDRRAALALVGALRRSATPAGALPERVDARTGVPRSTTPLAWSHAFAALALLELWPDLSSSRGGEAGNAR